MTSPAFDARQFAPATERNREPILAVLKTVLPPTGTVLEIASGTGEHASFFAPNLQPRQWLPSDPNPIALASIAAWREQFPAANLYPPIALDVCDKRWQIEPKALLAEPSGIDLNQSPITAIVNINMLHIAPWTACLGLMAGAGRLLEGGGRLYLYGPFQQAGQPLAPSNAAFDASLQAENPAWGVRNLDEVVAVAQKYQLSLVQTIPMPANNLSLVFERIHLTGALPSSKA